MEVCKVWDKFVGCEGEVVIVKGICVVKGGFLVEFEGFCGFILVLMIDICFVCNIEKFVG